MRILLAFLLVQSALCSAQKDYALQVLDTLCSDYFAGRGYVDQGDVKAADFLVSELEKIGVQPFKKQSYTQSYAFNVNTFPYPIEVVLDEDTLIAGADYLVDPISGSAQGEFKLVEINRENYKNFIRKPSEISKMDPSQTIFAFNFMETKNKELKKEIQALAYSTTKYFPVITLSQSKQMYSVGRFQTNYPLITIDSAAYKSCENVKLKVNNKYIPNYTSKNVIGWIPGKKKRKYVVLSAHYDHLGKMGPNALFPGANDNASGVAMLLSLAKYFKKHPQKYSIVFCFFSGEEAGLVGSKYFVEHPFFPLKKVKFVLNVDIMGAADEGITLVNGTKHEKAFAQMTSINEELNLLNKIKKRGPTANSDHYYFSEMGVPSFFIYSMGAVKNYHDIYDSAENTPLHKFDEVQTLLTKFVEQL